MWTNNNNNFRIFEFSNFCTHSFFVEISLNSISQKFYYDKSKMMYTTLNWSTMHKFLPELKIECVRVITKWKHNWRWQAFACDSQASNIHCAWKIFLLFFFSTFYACKWFRYYSNTFNHNHLFFAWTLFQFQFDSVFSHLFFGCFFFSSGWLYENDIFL